MQLVQIENISRWKSLSSLLVLLLAVPAYCEIFSDHADDPAMVSGAPRLDARHWGLFGGDFKWMDMDVSVSDLPIHPDGWGAKKKFNDSQAKQRYWDNIRECRRKGKFTLPILGLKGSFAERVEQLELMFSEEDGCQVYEDDLVGVSLGHEVTTSSDSMENRLYDYIKSRWPKLQVYKFYSGPIKPYSGLAKANHERCDGYLYDIYNENADTFRRTVQKFVITGKPVVILIYATEPGWGGFYKEDLVNDFDEKNLVHEGPAKHAEDQDGMIRKAPNSKLEKYFRHASGTLREFGLPVILFGVAGPGSINHWYSGSQASPNLRYIRQNMAFRLRDEMRNSQYTGPQSSADYSWGLGVEVVPFKGQTAFDYGLQQSAFRKEMKKVPRRIRKGPYVDQFLPDDLYLGLRTIDHATIRGFTHLVHTNDSEGYLITRDDSGQSGVVELMYRFFTHEGTLSKIRVELTGAINPTGQGMTSLALSPDGVIWQSIVTSASDTTQPQTIQAVSSDHWQPRQAFYVRVRMTYAQSPTGNPANTLDKLVVHAALHKQAP